MTSFNVIGTSQVLVVSTGVANSLAAVSTLCNRVDIQAKTTNSGSVFIGDSTVKNDRSNGIELTPGDSYDIEIITDILPIFVNGTSGDGVTFVYWRGERN